MARAAITAPRRKLASRSLLEEDPLWYKDAVIYEIHIRAFHDSNDDGFGDFKGLTSKLDYLQDLGVTALWLLPFYPSPLKDNGYDISDYTAVHEDYGTLRDFKEFLTEAHKRGLRVITELVINHTSDQHPWFQRARRSPPGSKWRDYYVWSDTPDKYTDARIIFKDFEHSNWAWDPVAKAYYWHRFYSHQPDLNFDNPTVRDAVFKAMEFWLDLGVDGMRLDAIPYLFEREGTTCENLPETHEFLKSLRTHLDTKYKGRMLLAEANQWPEDAVAYFGEGDECHMNFHFPLMPRMFMSLRMEDRHPIVDILEQTPEIEENCQWASFLRNHDELTLEMVTDEERDYMYRMYASDSRARLNLGIRRRLAPLLNNNFRQIELLNGLLMSMPGTPVLYYGDEIGMGDNIYLGDRDGVRTPMQWSPDRNAGFSRANPQKLYLPTIIDPEYHYESVNVEAQQANTESLLWWMKQLIGLRKQHRALSRGSLHFLHPENRKVLSYIRRLGDEIILVVANLSRFAECVELDLHEYKEMVPVELFGKKRFPPIGDLPYFITLSPHSFYYFSLEEPQARLQQAAPTFDELPLVRVTGGWTAVFRAPAREQLEALLPPFFVSRRWFAGKARTIKACEIRDAVPLTFDGTDYFLVLVGVEYTEGLAESYVVPVGYLPRTEDSALIRDQLQQIICRVRGRDSDEEGALYDAIVDQRFCRALLDAVARRRRFKSIENAEVKATRTRAFGEISSGDVGSLEPHVIRAEQSNTSIIYGNRFILKLFRKVESGTNPDLEISRFLTDRRFPCSPALAGSIDHSTSYTGRLTTLAILHEFVPNEGDAWKYTTDSAVQFLTEVSGRVSSGELPEPAPLPKGHLLELAHEPPPELASELFGLYLESVRTLGRRTAELHLALASSPETPDFEVENVTPHYQRSLYQSMRNLADRSMTLLRKNLARLDESDRPRAEAVLSQEAALQERFRIILDGKVASKRIRHHGDFHLGQVLYTGKDFLIIDFEGEPVRPISERRFRRSPFRDVAGMLRSFHYASSVALHERSIRPEDREALSSWNDYWLQWVSAGFVHSYIETAANGPFMPAGPNAREEMRILLDAFLLEKAVYELAYELGSRPQWVRIPLDGILRILSQGEVSR